MKIRYNAQFTKQPVIFRCTGCFIKLKYYLRIEPYDEYKTFIDEQKESLQEMVDKEITGYTSTKGNFVWTQVIADETIVKYEKDLEAIKNEIEITLPKKKLNHILQMAMIKTN